MKIIILNSILTEKGFEIKRKEVSVTDKPKILLYNDNSNRRILKSNLMKITTNLFNAINYNTEPLISYSIVCYKFEQNKAEDLIVKANKMHIENISSKIEKLKNAFNNTNK